MKFNKISLALILASATLLSACDKAQNAPAETPKTSTELVSSSQDRLDIYTTVALTTDLSSLSDNQKQMLVKLIDASKIMDDLFWQQSFGESKSGFLAKISDDKVKKYADVNYGPWDRLDGDKAFLTGYKDKPLGAQFYPPDITKEELNKAPFSSRRTTEYKPCLSAICAIFNSFLVISAG
jgi:hypothetical protein